MPMRTVHTLTLLALPAFALLCATPAPAQTVEGSGSSKVMMFDHPPSVDELRDVVAPPERRRTRSIEIIGGAANSAAQRPRQTDQANYSSAPAAPAAPQYQEPRYQEPAAEPAAASPPPRARHKAAHPQQAAVPAAEAAAPQPAPAADSAQAETKAFGFRINFAFNSAEIPRDAAAYIDAVGGLMEQDPQLSLVIEGHTDAVGSHAYNQTLSERRAIAVGEYLVRTHHVAPQRITVAGKAETQPLLSDPYDGRNRRVEFKPAR